MMTRTEEIEGIAGRWAALDDGLWSCVQAPHVLLRCWFDDFEAESIGYAVTECLCLVCGRVAQVLTDYGRHQCPSCDKVHPLREEDVTELGSVSSSFFEEHSACEGPLLSADAPYDTTKVQVFDRRTVERFSS